jgi:hypothetical protein
MVLAVATTRNIACGSVLVRINTSAFGWAAWTFNPM